MSGYVEEVERTISAHSSLLIADESVAQFIDEEIDNYLSGNLNERQIRFALERIARERYRSNARAAQDLARELTGQGQRWAPVPLDLNGEALKLAIADIQQALRDYKESERADSSLQLLKFRVRLSAEYASQKGFTDGQEISYLDLSERGREVFKVWAATFHEGSTCKHCIALHGQVARVGEEFNAPPGLKVYGTLYGPQAHVRCQCSVVYIVPDAKDVELFESGTVDLPLPPPGDTPRMIESEDIGLLPLKVFMAIIRGLVKAVSMLRKAVGL